MNNVAIWNPASGSAPAEEDLRAALGEGTTLVPTTEDDPGPGQALEAVKNGATSVIACGGDGTIRACIEPLLGTETSLDIVPLGTGNLLAGNLSIPSGLDGAKDAGKRPTTTIDVGFANDEAFAVMAGSGFDATMIGDADETTKSRFGRVAYIISAARHLGDALEVTSVDLDGKRWFTGRTSMVLVGNYGVVSGGLEVFPDAKPNDGLLDVAVLATKSGRDWVSVLWRLVIGKPQRPDLVTRGQAKTIRVHTRNPRQYELDGEARPETTDVQFSIRPLALKIHHGGEDDAK